MDFMDNSDHNLIQNITFISEDYDRESTDQPALVAFSTSIDCSLIVIYFNIIISKNQDCVF